LSSNKKEFKMKEMKKIKLLNIILKKPKKKLSYLQNKKESKMKKKKKFKDLEKCKKELMIDRLNLML